MATCNGLLVWFLAIWCVHAPESLALPGNVLEMQNLRTYPRPAKSETACFHMIPRLFACTPTLDKFSWFRNGLWRRLIFWGSVGVKVGCEHREVVQRRGLEWSYPEDVDSTSGKNRKDKSNKNRSCKERWSTWHEKGPGGRKMNQYCLSLHWCQKLCLVLMYAISFNPHKDQKKVNVSSIFLYWRDSVSSDNLLKSIDPVDVVVVELRSWDWWVGQWRCHWKVLRLWEKDWCVLNDR